MKIGYFGDGPWAHLAFEKMISDIELQIMFVVLRYETQDEKLKMMAEKRNIPVYVNKNINSAEFIELIKGYHADLFVSMSFNQIFKRELMDMPPLKTINCHAGKLPFYRGRNILNWVLINDEQEFGITVHYIDEGIDTGDIILQKCYPITDEDNYNTLLTKAYNGCADVLYEAIKMINRNELNIIKQKDIDEVGIYCGMRCEGDEIIDWKQGSREIFNFVRALVKPGPVATTFCNGYEVKINQVEMIAGAHNYKNIVGQIVGKEGNTLIVKTGDTVLKITDYESKTKIKVGSRLG